ncbi:hypothetical protein [Azovibrio restrictus]|uniref:hypothetical protein n=1 Tax=Azovibrio restrictus TaxID=146938 RepID=UPI0026EAA7B7|nr:hypothetical protein [Azovibrio restrictus]MDD3482502.1 hypothetical protein [Azovibrio restrictus]
MYKNEIQSFIVWYLPAIIGTHAMGVLLFFSDTGSVSLGYRADFLFSILGYVICGIWLFLNAPKHGLNKWLWGAFGLGGHLFAILLYFGNMAFNKSLNSQASPAGTPQSGAH